MVHEVNGGKQAVRNKGPGKSSLVLSSVQCSPIGNGSLCSRIAQSETALDIPEELCDQDCHQVSLLESVTRVRSLPCCLPRLGTFVFLPLITCYAGLVHFWEEENLEHG